MALPFIVALGTGLCAIPFFGTTGFSIGGTGLLLPTLDVTQYWPVGVHLALTALALLWLPAQLTPGQPLARLTRWLKFPAKARHNTDMTDILAKITTYKRDEIAAAKQRRPLRVIAEYARSAPRVRPFAGAIAANLASVHSKPWRSR